MKKKKFTYSLSGELIGGCIHSVSISRTQARRILGRRRCEKLSRLYPGTSTRRCETGLASSMFLFSGYHYKNIELWILVSPSQALMRKF